MGSSNLPGYLSTSRDLLVKAFPDPPSSVELQAIASVLAPHFSSRNLALVMEHAFGIQQATALHEVYSAESIGAEALSAARDAVLARLEAAGYQKWLESADE